MRPTVVEEGNDHKQSVEVSPPSCLDCLGFSTDGEIAVAAGDSVQVFIPKTKLSSYKDEFEESLWYKVRFVTNVFSRDEFPPMDPLSLGASSIGEEQSMGKVTGLKWSPPGIAKHNRCALAVLTSNHRLSIWASTSNQQEDTSWERVLVVNRALSDHFLATNKISTMFRNGSRQEQLIIQCRIRAFSWAENLLPMTTSRSSTSLTFESLIGAFLVAVTNDAGELTVVRIRSPSGIGDTNSSWTSEVVSIIDLPAGGDLEILDPFFGVPRFVSTVSWGPWTLRTEDGNISWHSKLAYIQSSRLTVVKCRWSMSESKQASFEVLDEQESFGNGHVGILNWSGVDGNEHLFTIRQDSIQRITWPLSRSSSNGKGITSFQELDSTWSKYSGVSLTNNSRSKQSLHLALHSTVNVPPGISFEWEAASNITKIQPKWKGAVQKRRKVFDRYHQLNGAVITKVLGLSSLPGTDHFAVCFKFHPSSSIEYLTASRAKGTMVFRAQEPENLDLLRLHNYKTNELLGDLKLEATVYAIKRWLRHRFLKKLDMESCREQLISSLLSLITVSPDMETDEKPTTIPEIVLYLRRKFNATPAFIRLVLQDTGYSGGIDTDDRFKKLPKGRDSIASDLCNEVLCIPKSLYDATTTDQRVLELCYRLVNPISPGAANISNDTSSLLEHCVICKTIILNESLTWSRCTNGHTYPRCGLTFQSIQVPGESKSCGFCNVPYLNKESRLINLGEAWEPATSDTGQPQPIAKEKSTNNGNSLMDILNFAFNVCIYCGAKLKG